MSASAPLRAVEREILLRIARDAIEAHVAGRSSRPWPEAEDGALARPAACFVTLRIDGDLRGCIGTLEADRPLAVATREMAIAAATKDPRFEPVGPDDLAVLRIGISVLTPRIAINDVGEVRVGTHGLAIQRGLARGVLLPQVAVDRGWDRESFLAATCVKAGLPRDAWRDPATVIEVFGSESVDEQSAQASG